MPDEITWPTWLLVVVGLGGVAGALIAILALLARAGRGMRSAAAWLGGIVRREVTEIVEAQLAAAVGPIMAELTPNHGTSARDSITRIETTVHKLSMDVTQHIAHSRADRADLRRWLETIDPGRTGRLPWPLDYDPGHDDDPGAPPDGGASSCKEDP